MVQLKIHTCRLPFSVNLGSKIWGSAKPFWNWVAALYSDSPCRMMWMILRSPRGLKMGNSLCSAHQGGLK